MKVRFTAWLTETERIRLKAKADAYGSSENYIVRLAIRQYLGLPVPTDKTHQTEGVRAVK